MMRRRTGVALAAAACFATVVSCYGPTEVRLEITTDLPCGAVAVPGGAASNPVHTLVRLGGGAASPVVADTTSCTARGGDGLADIGSIVLVPSGDRSAHVTVEVTATADGSDPDACGRSGTLAAQQAQCIVARRTFAFIKHTARSLPIRLYASCKGKVCDATQTCNQSGACESAAVSDDTGCIASEPDCHARSAAPPPPIDAGEAGDAQSADAADAAPKLPCTAANGTTVITTGSPTDFMAANSTQLMWIGTSAMAGTGVPVMAVDTQTPGSPHVLFPFVGADEAAVTAFAADDRAVWIGTVTKAYRYDLQTKNLQTFDIANTKAIASSTARDLAGPMLTTKAYAVTAVLDPSTTKATGGTYELRADGSFTAVTSTAATGIAASNRNLPTLFIIASKAFGGPSFSRATPIGFQSETFPVGDPVVGLATDDDTVFLSTGTAIQRIDPGGHAANDVFTVTVPGLVAVDQTHVFYEQKGSDSAIFRGLKSPPNAGIFPPIPERVASGYSDVAGLTIDAACVYFWSTPSIGGPTSLTVLPKTAMNGVP